MLSCRAMGMNVKRRIYEGVAVPTALYNVEKRSTAVTEEIKCSGDEMTEEYVSSNMYG